jgi:hypothetical protein
MKQEPFPREVDANMEVLYGSSAQPAWRTRARASAKRIAS